jgi:RNA polymerase sigma factor (sigma-70 family)
MKKYNIQNYIRYKEDIKKSMPKVWSEYHYALYTRNELIVKFLPLVENIARKFSTSQQASGVLSIMDLIQIGSEGLIKAVDKLNWELLSDSDDIEKTLKSFFSKRIKGAIRRRIDMHRGDIRIPEYKLNEIRRSPKDQKMVEMFFNSVFLSIDDKVLDTDINFADNVEDKIIDYNPDLFNVYLLSIISKYLNKKEFEVLKLSYGLNCDKLTAKDIAIKIGLKGKSSYVRVSEIKKEAIKKLIDNVEYSQVIDFM